MKHPTQAPASADQRPGTSRRLAGLALGAFALALATSAWAADRAPADVDGARIRNADAEPGNWMSHGRNYGETRFSPLKQITDENVDQLGLAWSYKLDFDRGVEATPLVVDGVMYTTGAFSVVYAFDARTGELLWKHDPEVDRLKAGEFCCDAVNRGLAAWEGKLYVGTLDGRLVAIDAKTGKRLWDIDTIIDRTRSYGITGAPRVVGDSKVIIGNGGAEFGVRGYVTAYDAETGEQAWRFFTVPGDPAKPQENAALEMAVKTWHGDNWVAQGGGGTAWDSFAYDPELNLLYIGVGNASYWNYGTRSEGKGDNLFLSSIVAVDADTGEYAWHYQTTPGDAWDFTATQHMILTELEIDGRTRKVLMQAPKNGFFYVIDRTDGELISAEAYVPMNWADGVDLETGRPNFTEQGKYWLEENGKKYVQPGFWGGHDWQPMSYNPQTGLVYIPAHIFGVVYENVKDPGYSPRKHFYQLGVAAAGMEDDADDMKRWADQWKGMLIAWDPVKQEKVWEQPYITIFNGGTLTTAGNLVFEGTADGRVVAYAADSGRKLWESPAHTGVMAAPVTYTVDGEQYVTFMAGWGGAFSTFAGGASLNAGVRPWAQVLTYKIGGDAVLPEPDFPDLADPEPPEATADTATVNAGRGLYNDNCSQCHGINAVSGGIVPDLRRLSAENHVAFPGIVYGGRANKGMPSYAETLTMDQVQTIHAYLVKRAWDLKKDLAAGRVEGAEREVEGDALPSGLTPEALETLNGPARGTKLAPQADDKL
ncbi:PQQ-dependent dehydrogenase, methanol/ethanol family [Coralloluteibacterium stylophorae]|uniref:PQQ-dependent dehydrogenase, methanol/ethanol family n=2 Tax=Coralloluteibacterium stylophorae TaxID=1776034 RepID=A0AAP2CEH6_9GAMM|nr:PQQ-dependent dehydrogenase, methanol/ethanol family [Coralloluteibacterium stylophorae]MBS7458885.1 PQQ-dependent dehydrogenase, methanol/ethanol family [Coralloluteibacterium stylophorae]